MVNIGIMCGINGFIRLGKDDNRYTKTWMESLVHDMNEKIIHRGPDAEGLYGDERCSLGMRRLSIIDIDTGSQPIYSSDKKKLIVFNGEIYNYRELRDELMSAGCMFSTQSDTEVVLQGIMEYGRAFINRLEGMFAFCYYDSMNHTWLLARDRVGEKPLYYYKGDKFFLFGSELKSLLGAGLIPKDIEEEVLTIYFQLGYIPAPMSIIKGVKKLMPATWMQIKDDGDIYSEHYWKLTVDENEQYQDYEWCKRELRDRLTSSVRRRMISDVPLGAFLSGGFDSAIIVGLMSRIRSHPVNTFTIGFKEKSYDESELATIVARKNGTKHHTVVLDWEEAVKDIDEILDNMDEPFADPSLVASYAVSKMTRQYVTAVLTGDAGDELFAGYNKYQMGYYGNIYKHIPRIIRKGVVETIAHHLPRGLSLYRKANKVIENANAPIPLQAKRLMSRAFSYSEAQQLLPGLKVNRLNFIKRQYDEIGFADDQKRLQYIDFHTLLEGQMLPKVDRSSMKAGLETRVPMLDSSVIELAFNSPSGFKIKGKKRKIILKDAFRELLPEELFRAPKHGFDVPVGAWMTGALKKELDRYSGDEYIKDQDFFNKSFIRELRSRQETGNIDWSTKLWSFFVFQHWYERYIKKGVF